jgi:hypothetical protein
VEEKSGILDIIISNSIKFILFRRKKNTASKKLSMNKIKTPINAP